MAARTLPTGRVRWMRIQSRGFRCPRAPLPEKSGGLSSTLLPGPFGRRTAPRIRRGHATARKWAETIWRWR